ncbi:MAG: matrixin family metalloprotease [Polyangiaceae bacterium]|nr:matrixin family metalloprotease [Polyangiaceae bacterium]
MSTLRRQHALFLCSALLAGLAALPSVGCVAASGSGAGVDTIENSGISFQEWKETVYQEPETGIWIVNGDVPIDNERELYEFFINNVQQGALVVHQVNGVDSKWDDTQKLNITYCVSDSFGADKGAVVEAMNAAGGAWAAAANVKFVYKAEEDATCTASNGNVVFDVRPVSGQQYLARAFFPYQSRSSRNVLIDSSSFGDIGVYTLTGILRHELGHTLGFRHEHTRPEAGKCFEDDSYRALTDYDSESVMHYPQCNGAQTGDLVLTAKDKAGVAELYGAPGEDPPPGGGGGEGGACAHDKCAAGSKLDPACDACVAKIGEVDPYCIETLWDSTCVGEVKSVCNEACAASSACVHDKCVTGAKLDAACDPCVDTVCAKDPYCCTSSWDSQCLKETNTFCGAGICQ